MHGFSKIATLLTLIPKTVSFTKLISSFNSVNTYIKAIGNSNFSTSNIKQAFLQLRQALTEAHILHCFDLKNYIQVETNISSYTIYSILSQLIPKYGL